jgi:hypothetical protein
MLANRGKLKALQQFTNINHQEFMREKLALSSHQNNKRIFLLATSPTSHQKL